MAQELKVDTVQSKSKAAHSAGQRLLRAGQALRSDSASRPQPDAFTNAEAFSGRAVSSCGVTLIELHARRPASRSSCIAVTIKGSRDPEVFHYQSIHMRFELAGVSQAQADDLVKTYQGRCPLYGTVSRASKMTVEVVRGRVLSGRASQSSLRFPALTTFEYRFSISLRRYAANSCGELPTGSAPSPVMKSRISCVFSAATISAWRRLMIAAGVPAGANMPYQLADMKPG